MKKIVFSLCIALMLFSASAFAGTPDDNDKIFQKLSTLPGVVGIEKIEMSHNIYKSKYKISFEQPVEPSDPSAGTFKQRLFLFHVDEKLPMVFVTEGYGAAYAASPRYKEEISELLNLNLLVAEHRYFLESTPKNDPGYKHFNAKNAAHDHHMINQSFKKFYKNRWVATGISKGGQTAMIYRAYYPDDVDVTVPYVAPLCRSDRDGRHEIFLAEFVGTPEQRQQLLDFQIELLKRKERMLPLMDAEVAKIGYSNYNIPIMDIYEYCVLEFPFAWWQWGSSFSTLPPIDASDEELFAVIKRISGPDYFSFVGSSAPFFIQAAKELGYYGYDLEPFREYIGLPSTIGYLSRIFTPKNMYIKFDDYIYKKVSSFLSTTDANMLFIYGEFDPWSAVKVDDPGHENIKIFIEPGGSHRSRISTLPEKMKEDAVSALKKWLKIK